MNRHALVIGNSEYQHLPDLRNPRADAKAIAELLSEAGFEVSLHLNTTRKHLLNVLDEFQQRLAHESVADSNPINNALLARPTVDEGWLVFTAQPDQFAVGNNLLGLCIKERSPDVWGDISIEKLEVQVKYRFDGQ